MQSVALLSALLISINMMRWKNLSVFFKYTESQERNTFWWKLATLVILNAVFLTFKVGVFIVVAVDMFELTIKLVLLIITSDLLVAVMITF